MAWSNGTPERELRGDEKKLYSRVRQTLWEYEPLRASHAEVRIEVQGRLVRLSGRVRTLTQKVIAGVLVKRLPEVEMLSNELVADPEVVRSVADLLASDERVAPYVPRVDARHGVVTLMGSVPSEEVRLAALEVASRSPLAAAVRDGLSVGGPTFRPYALARASEAAASGAEAAAAPRGSLTAPAAA